MPLGEGLCYRFRVISVERRDWGLQYFNMHRGSHGFELQRGVVVQHGQFVIFIVSTGAWPDTFIVTSVMLTQVVEHFLVTGLVRPALIRQLSLCEEIWWVVLDRPSQSRLTFSDHDLGWCVVVLVFGLSGDFFSGVADGVLGELVPRVVGLWSACTGDAEAKFAKVTEVIVPHFGLRRLGEDIRLA